MHLSLVDRGQPIVARTTICRISALGTRWRVRVESWEGVDRWLGRLVFVPDPPDTRYTPRIGPSTLNGGSQIEVIRGVHQIPESRLRQILHSSG